MDTGTWKFSKNEFFTSVGHNFDPTPSQNQELNARCEVSCPSCILIMTRDSCRKQMHLLKFIMDCIVLNTVSGD